MAGSASAAADKVSKVDALLGRLKGVEDAVKEIRVNKMDQVKAAADQERDKAIRQMRP